MVDGDGELTRGRDAGRRLAWADSLAALSLADQSSTLAAADLELMATAAYLLGRLEDCHKAMQRASRAYIEIGDPRRAARCVFWVAFTLLLQGDVAQAGGWLARASRLLEHERNECAEHGFLLLPEVLQALMTGDFATASAVAVRAAEIGTRVGDADLLALALHFHGRAHVSEGHMAEGLALLDEAMVAVVAGELSPYVAGNIYCSMIDACQEISDLRRAHEWTTALTTWCGEQPDMITFTGQCLVHRAEIMQLRGAWPEAIEEARRACERFALGADQYAVGAAYYRQAELYRVRGEFVAAADAYQQASQWGREPQPGLALLRLAQGGTEAAEAAIRRVVAETASRLMRVKLLPAHVEIMLAVGDLEAARASASEMADIAGSYDTPTLRALALHCRGAVLLADGDASAALILLRGAWKVWHELDVPHDAARIRVLVGLAYSALGDEDAAAMEFIAARTVFVQLGAAPDLEALDNLSKENTDTSTHGLTVRELQVLRLLVTGKTNHAIAAELSLADKTVERHVSNIFTKLGVPSRAAATAYAYQHNLL